MPRSLAGHGLAADQEYADTARTIMAGIKMELVHAYLDRRVIQLQKMQKLISCITELSGLRLDICRQHIIL